MLNKNQNSIWLKKNIKFNDSTQYLTEINNKKPSRKSNTKNLNYQNNNTKTKYYYKTYPTGTSRQSNATFAYQMRYKIIKYKTKLFKARGNDVGKSQYP